MTFQYLSKTITAAALSLGLASAVAAQDEEAVLEVTLAEETHSFTLSDLKSMPVSSFETTTIWTDGTQAFEGVSLKDLFLLVVLHGFVTHPFCHDIGWIIIASDVP